MENNNNQNKKPNQEIIIQTVDKKSNGMGTAGFILAIIGLLFSFIPVIGWIIWILGVLFSLLGLFKSPRLFAITGLIISFIWAIILTTVLVGVLGVSIGILGLEGFDDTRKYREQFVVDRVKDIRSAEQAFKHKYSRYTSSFDTLIEFILNDSLIYERYTCNKDDSVAMAKGIGKTETFYIPVIDKIFSPKNLSLDEVRNLKYIPFSENALYLLEAGVLEIESNVVVSVFECRAPYRLFLADLDHHELINLIDNCKTLEKYPGIKVGSMDKESIQGNWE